MTFQEFLESTGLTTTSFWGIVVFLTSIGIELVPKFKWCPWSTLIKWIGSRFNAKIDEKMDTVRGELKVLDKKIDRVQSELDKHVSESEAKTLEDTRRDILDFANACMNGRKHTQEQFNYVIGQCDNYEKYMKTNDVPNGVITDAIKEIHRINQKCMQNNSYLKEGERI